MRPLLGGAVGTRCFWNASTKITVSMRPLLDHHSMVTGRIPSRNPATGLSFGALGLFPNSAFGRRCHVLVKANITAPSLFSTCQKKVARIITPIKNDAIRTTCFVQPQPSQVRIVASYHRFDQRGPKLGAALSQEVAFLKQFITKFAWPLLRITLTPFMKVDHPTTHSRLFGRRLPL